MNLSSTRFFPPITNALPQSFRHAVTAEGGEGERGGNCAETNNNKQALTLVDVTIG